MNLFDRATSKQDIPTSVLDLNADTPLPSEPTMVRVSVHEVEIYEDNPRRFHANDKYAELRESILKRGLDTTLQITQRPNDTRKILRRGGGTRITIMRECFEETGDYMKHGSFEAMFYPWTGELDVMLGHMTENALHSPLTLFERAHEELLIRSKIIAGDESVGAAPDEGFATATLEERVARYRELGYPLDKRTLSTYGYIIDRLSPHLDTALRAGVGRPKIEAIKKIEKATEVMISARDPSVLEDYRSIFEQALTACNSVEFSVDSFGDTLGRLVSSRLGIDPADLASKPRSNTKRRQPRSPAVSKARPRKKPTKLGKAEKPGQSSRPGHDGVSQEAAQQQEVSAQVAIEAKEDIGIEEIRDRARTTASSLAQEHGLVVSSVYCHEEFALGFALEQPDAADIMGRESFIDSMIVHRELHAMFWALLNIDVQFERIHHGVLGEYSDQSSPRSVIGSNSYHSASHAELHWKLAQMRITAITDKSRGRDSTERRVVEGLDQLWKLAELYIEKIGQQT